MQLVDSISDRTLRRKVRKLLRSYKLILEGRPQPSLPLIEAPAAEKIHHNYREGLLEHTIASVKLGLTLCNLVENHYKGKVDRDIVLAALILHDLFKVYSYEKSDGGFRRSVLGLFLDHHTAVVSELIKRGFPVKVIHAVLAAHGRFGPSQPKTVEALIVHLADYLDSTLASEIVKGAQLTLEREGVKPPEPLTVTEALKILYEKGRSG